MSEYDQSDNLAQRTERLDHSFLIQLKQYLSDQELEDTLHDYFEDCITLLDNLKNAASENKLEEVIRHVHTLKGNSKTLGSTVLADYCQLVENQLKKDGKMSPDLLNLQTFELQLKSFRTALEAGGFLSNKQ